LADQNPKSNIITKQFGLHVFAQFLLTNSNRAMETHLNSKETPAKNQNRTNPHTNSNYLKLTLMATAAK